MNSNGIDRTEIPLEYDAFGVSVNEDKAIDSSSAELDKLSNYLLVQLIQDRWKVLKSEPKLKELTLEKLQNIMELVRKNLKAQE